MGVAATCQVRVNRVGLTAAVAYAAMRLGKPAKIFVPSVSSVNFDITR